MMPLDAAARAWLENDTPKIWVTLVEIWTQAGRAYCYSDGDIDLTWQGRTYSAHGPLVERDQITRKLGIEVGEAHLVFRCRENHALEAMPFVQAARAGLLDGARIVIRDVALAPGDTAPRVVIHLFEGLAGQLDVRRHSVDMQVQSDLVQLNTQIPRGTYQPQCNWTLYDQGCRIARASVTRRIVAQAGSNRLALLAGDAPPDGQFAGQFAAGTVTGVTFWPYDISCSMNNCIIQGGGGAYGNYAIGGHGARVHFTGVLFKSLPADGLVAEATDKAWFDFDGCVLDATALCPVVSAKNGSIVSFKRCGFDLSTSYCEPGSLVMGDTAANLNQFGVGLPGLPSGYVVLAGGTAGRDGYNEGGMFVAYGHEAPGSDGGALICYFGSRVKTNMSSKFQISFSDETGSREVFRVRPFGIALPSVGYQFNGVDPNRTSGFENTLFVDATDNRLKFRDSSGAVRVVAFQ